MSVQATTWVWENSESTGTARLVLLAIADAANREGKQSYQSAPSIAKMTGVSVRSVWRAIEDLEARGEVAKVGKHGEYQTTVYELPAVSNCHSDKMARRDTQGSSAVPNSSTAVPPIGTQPHKTPVNPIKKATKVRDNFTPSRELIEWAKAEAPLVEDLKSETEQFIDYHASKGSLMKDWGRAWKTWIRNQQKWSAPKQQAGPSPWSKEFHQ